MRIQGTVKWWSNLKGHGFIVPDDAADGAADCFVHYSQIEGEGKRDLYTGQRVEFDRVETARGPQAQRVKGLH